MRESYECSDADDCTCDECQPWLYLPDACCICGGEFPDEAPMYARGGDLFACVGCVDEPMPVAQWDPETLDMFAAEAPNAR